MTSKNDAVSKAILMATYDVFRKKTVNNPISRKSTYEEMVKIGSCTHHNCTKREAVRQ